jgi:hypothetical protein
MYTPGVLSAQLPLTSWRNLGMFLWDRPADWMLFLAKLCRFSWIWAQHRAGRRLGRAFFIANSTIWRCFHGELDGRPSALEVAEDILYMLWDMRPDHKCGINVTEPQRWFILFRAKSQFLTKFHISDRELPIVVSSCVGRTHHLSETVRFSNKTSDSSVMAATCRAGAYFW